MRAVDVAGRVLVRRRGGRGAGELVEDAAVARRARLAAQPAQLAQLALEGLQLGHAPGDVTDVLVEQRVYLLAVLVRRLAEPEQRAYLIQRHVESAAVADELKALDVRLAVEPVIAR